MNKSPSYGMDWFQVLWIVYYNFEWESSSSLDILNVPTFIRFLKYVAFSVNLIIYELCCF